ncbi:MAG: DUF4838 domain-containing protein [Oscillospiraceae bacterium]|nr:DUF4838 domain-containing protein [Oscillospiraceae bacterium]MBQ9939803.1 DUF4838 domain-containing protein [Oscillospiraceae bacterium]
MFLRIARISYDPVVAYASEELKRCLEKMDPSLEIVLLTYPKWRADIKNALWVGMDDALCANLPEVENKELDDAIAIDVDGGVGYITGANPRAVLIAAFRYLRELGAMWVRPNDGEYLPACTVADRVVKVAEAPSCRHRGICIEGADSVDHVINIIDWMPRVGLNAYFNEFWVPAAFYMGWYKKHFEKHKINDEITKGDVEGIRDTSIYEMKRRGMLYHVAGHGWTCEPLGIDGIGWGQNTRTDIPEETYQYLALTKGKRQFWNNIPLNTNLCYSNPKVRKIMTDAIAEYCENNPMVDYLHVWMADDGNNHCECENCTKKRPADWYMAILNEADAKLTAKGLDTKIVFLMYNDLNWPPVESVLNNPDRFVLMYAPVGRSYSRSYKEAGDFDMDKIRPFVYNHITNPNTVEENLAMLRKWKEFFKGDTFTYDYHYMWDNHRDPAHMALDKVLFEDMQCMRDVGLGGMVSCQNQRVWAPSGFGITAMAEALWNKNADFDTVADNYFKAAFGSDGILVRSYLEQLSQLFNPKYMRCEIDKISPEVAESAAKIPAFISEFGKTISRNLCAGLPEAQRRSWEYLDYHKNYCTLLAAAVECRAKGDEEGSARCWDVFEKYINENEEKYAYALDTGCAKGTIGGLFKENIWG